MSFFIFLFLMEAKYIAVALIVGFIAGVMLSVGSGAVFTGKGEKHEDLASIIEDAKERLKAEGRYRCCLNHELCTYCLVKEGECDCAIELVTGGEICEECLGEWIEGNGHVCAMMRMGFAQKYPEIWGIIKDKYRNVELGACPMMG